MEIQKTASLDFNDKSIRSGFIRKVFGLVTIMLLIVTSMTSITVFVSDIRNHMQQHIVWLYIGIGTFLMFYFPMLLMPNLRRRFPLNLICTAILTLAVGFMTATACAHFESKLVLIAFGITVLCTVIIVLFSLQTKYESSSGYGFSILFIIYIFLIGGIAALLLVIFKRNGADIYIVCIAPGILMLLLYIDIQWMMGGKRKCCKISPEDYIFAAVQLFIDIMLIFFFVLLLVVLIAALIAGGGKGCSGNGGGGCDCNGCNAGCGTCICIGDSHGSYGDSRRRRTSECEGYMGRARNKVANGTNGQKEAYEKKVNVGEGGQKGSECVLAKDGQPGYDVPEEEHESTKCTEDAGQPGEKGQSGEPEQDANYCACPVRSASQVDITRCVYCQLTLADPSYYDQSQHQKTDYEAKSTSVYSKSVYQPPMNSQEYEQTTHSHIQPTAPHDYNENANSYPPQTQSYDQVSPMQSAGYDQIAPHIAVSGTIENFPSPDYDPMLDAVKTSTDVSRF